VLWTAAEIYESLVFTDQASSGQRIYVEWVATAFGGKQLRGSTILVTNEEGKIDHAVVQHRPLEGLAETHSVFLAEVETAQAADGMPLAYFRGRMGRFEFMSVDAGASLWRDMQWEDAA
jgi:hypothetical protein